MIGLRLWKFVLRRETLCFVWKFEKKIVDEQGTSPLYLLFIRHPPRDEMKLLFLPCFSFPSKVSSPLHISLQIFPSDSTMYSIVLSVLSVLYSVSTSSHLMSCLPLPWRNSMCLLQFPKMMVVMMVMVSIFLFPFSFYPFPLRHSFSLNPLLILILIWHLVFCVSQTKWEDRKDLFTVRLLLPKMMISSHLAFLFLFFLLITFLLPACPFWFLLLGRRGNHFLSLSSLPSFCRSLSFNIH